MLHRVVLKRSGRPSPEASALGFTAAHHLICEIVGKPVIAAGYCWILGAGSGSMPLRRSFDWFLTDAIDRPPLTALSTTAVFVGFLTEPIGVGRRVRKSASGSFVGSASTGF
jgi:hypothetical protein